MSARGTTDVRGARAADLGDVQRLLREAALPADDLDARALEYFFVAQSHDGIVGAVGLVPAGTDALLRSLVVAPAARGAGLGQDLCGMAEAHARENGVRQLWLLTTTAAEFFAARAYERAAREAAPAAIREHAEFAALCPASAICMTRRP